MTDLDPRIKMDRETRERLDTVLYGLFFARGVTSEDIEHATDRYVETVNEGVEILIDGKQVPMCGEGR
jgi:hypothetical protein